MSIPRSREQQFITIIVLIKKIHGNKLIRMAHQFMSYFHITSVPDHTHSISATAQNLLSRVAQLKHLNGLSARRRGIIVYQIYRRLDLESVMPYF